jgi:hypothetical protein
MFAHREALPCAIWRHRVGWKITHLRANRSVEKNWSVERAKEIIVLFGGVTMWTNGIPWCPQTHRPIILRSEAQFPTPGPKLNWSAATRRRRCVSCRHSPAASRHYYRSASPSWLHLYMKTWSPVFKLTDCADVLPKLFPRPPRAQPTRAHTSSSAR